MTIGYPIRAKSMAEAVRLVKEFLDTGIYTYRILRIDLAPREIYPEADRKNMKVRWYTVTYDFGPRKKGTPITKHTYELRYPYAGGSWQKVEATSATAARRKFTKGTTYKPSQVKIRFVK